MLLISVETRTPVSTTPRTLAAALALPVVPYRFVNDAFDLFRLEVGITLVQPLKRLPEQEILDQSTTGLPIHRLWSRQSSSYRLELPNHKGLKAVEPDGVLA